MAANELRCTICPKAPTFSDQSHLLTHIGSKGHLSHYFKAQVRSRADISIRQRLAAYDEWYRKHDIAVLLSQRLETKEVKQRKVSKRTTAKSLKADEEVLSLPKAEFEPFPFVPTMSANDIAFDDPCIDPYLEQSESCEAETHGNIPHQVADNLHGKSSELFRLDHFPSLPNYQAPSGGIPPSQSYGQNGYWFSQIQPLKQENVPQNESLVTQDWFLEQAPSDNPVPSVEGSIPASHSRNTSTTEGSTEFDAKSNSHRLKGIIWPGMDIFDTANEESKRRRNQKKDISAVHRLAEHSKSIEPTEVIFFYPSWEVKKARFISGNVESSPPRDITPEPKTRLQRKRRVLNELDPNVPVNSRKTRGKKRFRNAPGPVQRRKFNGVPSGSEDETIDLMRPLYGQGKQRSRAFKVFEDSPNNQNAWFNHEEYTPTPLYPAYSFRSGGNMQQTLEVDKSAPPFANSHSACTPKAESGLEDQNLWPALRFGHPLFPPESPLQPRTLGSAQNEVEFPLLITPRRVFQQEPVMPKAARTSAEAMKLHKDHDSQLHSAKRSPTHFSLADLLAYNRNRTPYCSPQQQIQQYWSPSYFDSKTGIATDMAGVSSGDETIDLGIGAAE